MARHIFIRPRLEREEFATILAALRYYVEQGQGDPDNRSDRIHNIATDCGDITSLDGDEVSALADRLNGCGDLIGEGPTRKI